MTRECSTFVSAWKVTANNVLASAYVLYQIETQHGVKAGDGTLHALFNEAVDTICNSTMAKEECQLLHDWLVRRHGYQFAREMFAKSSIKELAGLAKASSEERRATNRHTKAWNGSELPDDHGRYWKQVRWLSPMIFLSILDREG
jgi:hypothetical protein